MAGMLRVPKFVERNADEILRKLNEVSIGRITISMAFPNVGDLIACLPLRYPIIPTDRTIKGQGQEMGGSR